MKLNKKTINIFAFLLLTLVFFLALFSMKGDSLTMDEVAHLPAGYSYLTQKDYRLNPEHPPLLKDLAAFPLLFVKGIKFPSDIKDWKEDVNGQWGFGYHFLYHMGNPADKIIFWGRIPMILLLIFCGFFVFKFARDFFDEKVAILALFFFSFSPTFLAHGRLVTTDVGAAFGIVLATYFFLKALKEPTKKNIILAGVSLGIAELLKFSLILLPPLFVILGIIWALVFKNWKTPLKVLGSSFLIWILIVWIVYFYHTFNYPPQRQLRDTQFLLSTFSGGPSTIKDTCLRPKSLEKAKRCLAEITIFLSDKPIIRALAHYALGLLMVFQRAAGGHTTYFLGEVSASGWKIYFPFVYLIKEPLAFHLLTILVLIYFALKIKEPFYRRTFGRLKNFIKENFEIFSMICFILLYWAVSLKSHLNIGVRHLLPVFPFTMILVSKGTILALEDFKGKLKTVALSFLTILLVWQAISILKIYPHFLSYANEIVGGPDNLYLYTVNSNLDWGQDLKRLKKWVDEKKIEKIYVDYFGGGDAKYYLKEKFLPWWGTRNPKEMPKGSWLAVSATFLQGGRGLPHPGFNQPWGYYLWLNKYKPKAKIGYSIFVYFIE